MTLLISGNFMHLASELNPQRIFTTFTLVGKYGSGLAD